MANQQSAKQLAGVIGFFEDAHGLVHATEKVRDENYRYFDCFTPFPIHGLDGAQGLKRSPIPFVTFAAGITGCSLGFLLQYWTSAVDWPLNVGGKPFNSWPAFVPVMFELTILFAGLSTVGAMLLFNGLPNVKRRSFDPRLTNDRFAILIEAPLLQEDQESQAALKKQGKNYKSFVESEALELLKKLGAKEIKSVYSEGWF
jgi:hypothetical protein